MKNTSTKEKAAGISDAAVRAKTGKGWSEWFRALDAAGARQMDHKAIVAHLGKHHGALSGWWQQMVTVAYEQKRGKREKHQTSKGYAVSVTRTMGAPLTTLYAAWTNEKVRNRWLPKATLTISKATSRKSLRILWENTSRLDVYFYAKSGGKNQVTVDHYRLPDAAAARHRKVYWGTHLDKLKALLESSGF